MTLPGPVSITDASLLPEGVIAAFVQLRGVCRRELMDSTLKTAPVVWARHDLTWCLRDLTNLSLVAIGQAMDGRDPTTVANSLEQVERRIDADPAYRASLIELRRLVEGYDPTLGPVGLARSAIASGARQSDLTRALAFALVAVAALMRSDEITDAEARQAAISILGAAGGVA